MKIKYPLSPDKVKKFHDRLDEVLSRKEGQQVIILWDDDRLTDYYQNTCVKSVVKEIEKSAKEYSEQCPMLISDHD